MEYVNKALALLKKYHFWVMWALILILSPVAWYLASGDLYQRFQGQTSKIKSTKSDLERIRTVSQHPNEDIIAGVEKETQKLRYKVWALWDELYRQQRNNVLKWPKEMGDRFIDYVEKLSFKDEIPVDLRENYQNYIEGEVEKLPERIDAKVVDRSPESETGEAKRRTPTANTNPDYVVIWGDYDRIRRKLVRKGKKPTSIWVWVTQEDLWIYQTLLTVIDKTNDGATGPHNATVSVIEHMDVGKPAASEAAAVGRLAAKEQGPTAQEVAREEMRSQREATEEAELLDNRYVDENGKPIKATDAVKASEYKRVPVLLKVRMDPGKIHRLIVECANADLPVEVQQVRMNPGDTGRRSTIRPEELESDREAGRKVVHVPVIVQGVIYIFNPPNLQKIGITEEEIATGGPAPDGGAVPDGSGEPQPPAGEPGEKPAVPLTKTAAETTGTEKTGTEKTGTEKTGTERAGAKKYETEKRPATASSSATATGETASTPVPAGG